MSRTLADSLALAAALILRADAELLRIVGLSLRVGGSACLIGAFFGLALGAWLYATLDGVGSGREVDRLSREHDAYRFRPT